VKKEGEEVPEMSEPLQLVMKTMVRQVVPLQPMEVHAGADLHLQPMEGTPRRSRWMPEGGCDPVGSPVLEQAPARTGGPVERGAHTGAGLLRACDPMGDPCWSSLFLKDCSLWEGPTLVQSVKSCTL